MHAHHETGETSGQWPGDPSLARLWIAMATSIFPGALAAWVWMLFWIVLWGIPANAWFRRSQLKLGIRIPEDPKIHPPVR